ncbi:hypothetical protein FRX31_006524 [Thalictrum thalictroides]|uniref:Uncharacterized protein n=1 Tax=Thalictrum thalictroides TaxID=46969 RepID=A0A7J6X2B4_THATH|nr:hypothetical protein FRX31_006524 [Thalictrum thalictroides]
MVEVEMADVLITLNSNILVGPKTESWLPSFRLFLMNLHNHFVLRPRCAKNQCNRVGSLPLDSGTVWGHLVPMVHVQ